MKKVISVLLLFCALALSGCVQEPQETADTGTTAASTAATTAPTTAPTEAPFDLSKVAVPGGEGFYELTLLPQLAELTITDGALLDEDTLLLLTGDQQDTLMTFDLQTGTLSTLCCLPWAEEIPAQQDEWEGFWIGRYLLCADPIVLYGYGEQEQCFLVGEDGTVTELPVSYEDGAVNYFGCIYGENSLYYYSSGRFGMQRMDYATQTVSAVGTIPTEYLYSYIVGQTPEGEAVLSAEAYGSQAVTLVMDLQTGEITAAYEGYCSDALIQRWETEALNDGDDYTDYLLTSYAGDQQASATFSVTWLSRCSGDPSEALSGWLGSLLQGQVSGKSLLYTDWSDGERTLILWDYGADALTERQSEALTAFQGADYEAPTERIAQMEQTYGVTIYAGDAVLNAPIPDYTLSVWEDDADINAALDALEEAFSRYPEGYLAQLGGSDTRAICFYLSGEMIPVDPEKNIQNPGGLACRVGDLELIALDARGYIRAQDVIHELTHILDHQLAGVLDEEYWNSLNPEGFQYPYSYFDEDGNSYEWGDTTYTAAGFSYYEMGDVESVYFVDAYATSYPTEDRARLMEYLLRDPESGPEQYFASTHIQQKLTYYFQLIREAFDTTGWDAQTVWEAELAEATVWADAWAWQTGGVG